jgi:EAL domain-containing protein (putative c-di-GMP-specific phosphodiesterase class I)
MTNPFSGLFSKPKDGPIQTAFKKLIANHHDLFKVMNETQPGYVPESKLTEFDKSEGFINELGRLVTEKIHSGIPEADPMKKYYLDFARAHYFNRPNMVQKLLDDADEYRMAVQSDGSKKYPL